MQGRLKRERKERQESMEEKNRQEKGGREGQPRKDGRKGQTEKVKFDITEYLKLVFPFQEADADK